MSFYWRRTPAIFQWAFPGITWNVKTREKNLFLTFDDGPSPEITTKILKILKLHNIKATFFCLGQNLGLFPMIAEKIVEKGHVIANHTYSHYNGWQTGRAKYAEDVEKCQNMISSFNQETNRLFRPPYGKMDPLQYFEIKKNYQIVMWSLMIGDFDIRLSKESCLRLACDKTSNGDIIVFHDNEQSVETLSYVLPGYLDFCLDNGYEFALIPACPS